MLQKFSWRISLLLKVFWSSYLLSSSGGVHIEDGLIIAEGSSTDPNLYFIDLSSEQVKALLPPEVAEQSRPLAVTVDEQSGEIYWTVMNNKIIHSYNEKNSNFSTIFSDTDGNEEEEMLECLTVDKTTKYLYFCHGGCIDRIHIHTKKKECFIKMPGMKPTDVALDIDNRLIYWANSGSSPGIYKASLNNPAERVAIVSTQIVSPQSIALDLRVRKIYWGEPNFGRIEYSNLDGSGRNTLYQGIIHADEFFKMVVDHYNLFYTDNRKDTVIKIHKSGGGQASNLRRPRLDMANGIVHYRKIIEDEVAVTNPPTVQPDPISTIFTSRCRDGVNCKVNSTTSSPSVTSAPTSAIASITMENIEKSHEKLPQNNDTTKASSSGTTIIVCAVVLILVAGLVAMVACVVRKKYRKRKPSVGTVGVLYDNTDDSNVYAVINYSEENIRNERNSRLVDDGYLASNRNHLDTDELYDELEYSKLHSDRYDDRIKSGDDTYCKLNDYNDNDSNLYLKPESNLYENSASKY